MAEDFTCTREKNVDLAKELETYPCLWDRDDENNRNKEVKSKAIDEIAQKLNVSRWATEARIKNIIGQFQREYRKERGAIESVARNGRKPRTRWFLYDHLRFLERTAVSRCSTESTSSLENLLIEETEIERDYENGKDGSPSEDFNSHLWKEDRLAVNDESNSLSWNQVDCKYNKTLKRNRVDALSKVAVSLGSSPLNRTNDKDEWDLFGALIAKKIRALRTPISRMQTENEINNILFRKQAEEAGFTVLNHSTDPVICKKPD